MCGAGIGLHRAEGGGCRAAGCLGTPQVRGLLPTQDTWLLSPSSPSVFAQAGAGGAFRAALAAVRASPREPPSSTIPMFGPQLQQVHKRQGGEGAGTGPAASGLLHAQGSCFGNGGCGLGLLPGLWDCPAESMLWAPPAHCWFQERARQLLCWEEGLHSNTHGCPQCWRVQLVGPAWAQPELQLHSSWSHSPKKGLAG